MIEVFFLFKNTSQKAHKNKVFTECAEQNGGYVLVHH